MAIGYCEDEISLIEHLISRVGMKRSLLEKLRGVHLHQEQRREELSSMHWCTVPDDLLNISIRKLNSLYDCLSFGACCRDWKNVYTEAISLLSFTKQLPLLMIPVNESRKLSFLALFSNDSSGARRFYEFKGNIPENCDCVGSTLDCAVFQRNNSSYDTVEGLSSHWGIVLLNPFSSMMVEFPAPSDTVGMRKRIMKLVLSENILPNKDYVLAGIVFHGMAYLKPGEDWNIVQSVGELHDVIFYKNQIYCVSGLGDLLSFDYIVSHQDPYLILVATRPGDGFITWSNRNYVVESGEHLLMISRKLEVRHGEHYMWFETVAFRIYSFDEWTSGWNVVTTLEDKIVFLGSNSSFSTTPSAGCRSNIIYFGSESSSDDGWERVLDSVIVDVNSGIIQHLFATTGKDSPVWIEPGL